MVVAMSSINGLLFVANSLTMPSGIHKFSPSSHKNPSMLNAIPPLRTTRPRLTVMKADEGSSDENEDHLRTMFSPPWVCVKKCASCCYLAPKERDLDCLSEQERALYISMAAPDGWCVNLDRQTHLCKIYETRPSFCRIENLQTLYKVADDDMGDFAAESCREHIESVYGDESDVMERFEDAQYKARTDAGWEIDEDGDDDEDEEEVSVEDLLEIRKQVLAGLKAKSDDKELKRALKEIDAAIKALGGEA